MLSTLILALLVPSATLGPVDDWRQDSQENSYREMALNSLDTSEPLLLIQEQTSQLDPPKISPLNSWEFPFVAAGYARANTETSYNQRFQVFDQFSSGKTHMVCRMLLRLWDMNRQRLNLDHALTYHQRTVQVYLAFGGEPGAEQKFMEDPTVFDERNKPVRVNNIYIYAITTLDDPLEFAREIAHEYGHAILPPIGSGYSEPEKWAIGDIGERIYMTWLLEGMNSGKLKPDDVMGTPLSKMDAFYNKVVLPDLSRVATKGPDFDRLKRMDKSGFEEMLGLTSYLASLMPNKVFSRTLVLTGSPDPMDYHKSVIEAATERDTWQAKIPAGLKGQAIWIPLPEGEVKGAKQLQRKGDWVKVQPTSGTFTVVNSLKG